MAYIYLKHPKVFLAQTKLEGISVCFPLDPTLLKAQMMLLNPPPPAGTWPWLRKGQTCTLNSVLLVLNLPTSHTTSDARMQKEKYSPCPPGVYCLVGFRENSKQRKMLNLSSLGSLRRIQTQEEKEGVGLCRRSNMHWCLVWGPRKIEESLESILRVRLSPLLI